VTEDVTTEAGLRVIPPAAWGPDLGLVHGGSWREMVGPGTGAACRSMYTVVLEPAGSTRVLRHSGEATYYVADGEATVVEHLADGAVHHDVTEGSMVHAHAGAAYSFESAGGARLVGGPAPVDRSIDAPGGELVTTTAGPGVSIHHRDRPGLQVPFISRDARLVVWLGRGMRTANMNYVVLEPGERNREHVHKVSEDTIHILEGHGTAENVTTGERIAFGPGDTVHIEIGFWHAVEADRGERVVSVGGPCPADTDMLRAAGVDVDALLSES